MPIRLLALLLVAAISVSACGDDDGPRAQPATDEPTFVGGSFDEIPIPPLADPLSPESVLGDGTVVQSFAVRNRTVRSAMDFYVDFLDERPVISSPRVVSEEGAPVALRGEWLYEDRTLRITIQPAPTVEGDSGDRNADQVVQLSLQLLAEGSTTP